MAGLRRFTEVDSSQSSAWTARHRLLDDRQMRCHHALRGRLTPSSDTIRPQASFPRKLSLTEQQRQAIQIARTFDRHYLAALHYGDDDGVVTALLQPVRRRAVQQEVAHEIRVDAAGNVMVARCGHVSARHGVMVRVSMFAIGTALLVGGLLSIL